jgi:hypothetical protein
MTFDELIKAVKDLGTVLEETRHEESRQKALKKDMASKLADLEMKRQELGQKISVRRETREVEVEVRADYAKGVTIETRTDTWEDIGTRPLSWDEKQLGLPKLDTSPVVSPPPATPVDGPLLESCENCGHVREACTCPAFVPFGTTTVPPPATLPYCSWCAHDEAEHEPVKTDGTDRICLHEGCTCGAYEVESPAPEVPVSPPEETPAVDPAPAEVAPPSQTKRHGKKRGK